MIHESHQPMIFKELFRLSGLAQTGGIEFEVWWFRDSGKYYSDLTFKFDPSVENPHAPGGFWDQWRQFLLDNNLMDKKLTVLPFSPVGFPVMHVPREMRRVNG